MPEPIISDPQNDQFIGGLGNESGRGGETLDGTAHREKSGSQETEQPKSQPTSDTVPETPEQKAERLERELKNAKRYQTKYQDLVRERRKSERSNAFGEAAPKTPTPKPEATGEETQEFDGSTKTLRQIIREEMAETGRTLSVEEARLRQSAEAEDKFIAHCQKEFEMDEDEAYDVLMDMVRYRGNGDDLSRLNLRRMSVVEQMEFTRTYALGLNAEKAIAKAVELAKAETTRALQEKYGLRTPAPKETPPRAELPPAQQRLKSKWEGLTSAGKDPLDADFYGKR